jgi:hypothetical protein
MVMFVIVIGIERVDPRLLNALRDPGQSDLIVAGCWSQPRNEAGGCNDLGYGAGNRGRALTRGNGETQRSQCRKHLGKNRVPICVTQGRMGPGGARNVPTR